MEIIITNPWVPVEWIAAHGFTPRGVWSAAEASAPAAEGVCAFAQMARDQATLRGTPVIFTTACDQMRRAADAAEGGRCEVRSPKSEVRNPNIADPCSVEVDHGADQENFGLRTSDFFRISDFGFRISDFPPAEPTHFLFNIPATWQTAASRQLYRAEVTRLGKFLQRLGGTAPTTAALEAEMQRQEKIREEIRQFAKTASAREIASALGAHASSVSFPASRRKHLPTDCSSKDQLSLCNAGSGATPEPARGRRALPSIPLALVGGPLCASQWGIFDAIESAGGCVVLNATEPGERCLLPPLPAIGAPASAASDAFTRLCDHYFDNIVDVFQRPNSRLYDWLGNRLSARGVRGIVLWVHIGCDLWRAEAASLREAFGLPVLTLDSVDIRSSGLRDLNRLAAFIESLAGAPTK